MSEEMTLMRCAVGFKDVDAGYRTKKVLRCINLEITDGHMVGISGPNGSGKTTLLRAIQGLLPVISGPAYVCGIDLDRRNYRSIRRQTACVFQTSNTDPRMPISAKEVVMMGRYARLGLFKRPGVQDFEIVKEFLTRVDAQHLADRPYGHLSGGEQQRVNLARALAQHPKLLLLDEPTTFLDSESQERIIKVIKSIHSEEKLTTIIVSHDYNILTELCSEIVVMKSGKVEQIIQLGGCTNA
jgi:ABC-type cobalamin/Fe3+-siderophores transport system ATPase subunit